MNFKYKNIFFDFDDTLWDIHTNGKEALSETFEQYRLDEKFSSFEEFYGIYMPKNHELWEKYRSGMIRKKELVLQRFLYPLQQGGINDEAYALKMSDDFLEATSYKTKLIPYAKEILEYLYPRYRMFILSNGFSEVQYKKLRNSGLDRYFEKVILSENAEANKPSPEIFDYALKNTNSRRKESVMIGDSWDADIVGAKNSRIDQIFLDHEGKTDMDFQPTYLIKSLKELKEIL
ncbi:MAG: YjjG family noncanonical pyrimidine nucleotidase [Candidatus Azobacteroides sp.]|nr:YjjG family noncanonical pyrimidine nucleotidase [Candidatus Azobacteroides sp.]